MSSTKGSAKQGLDDETFSAIFDRLGKYELTKPELLMILNLRPQGNEMLEPIIEEKEARFSEAELKHIANVISELLGNDDESEET